MEEQDLIIWLDLETTGLNPHSCEILEIAAFASTLEGNRFTSCSRYGEFFHSVARISHNQLERVYGDETLHAMHHESGLLAECVSPSAEPIHKMLKRFSDWLDRFDGCKIMPGGFSVHFDVEFLKAAGGFRGHFSHHHVDVSSIDKAFRAAGQPSLKPPSGSVAHRAVADAQQAWSSYRLALDRLHRPAADRGEVEDA